MDLTPDEQPVVRRAVAAYLEMKKKEHEGAFGGTTANEILEELKPSPVRWNELASFVIERAEKPRKYLASSLCVTAMQEHFSQIAGEYRAARTTDVEPLLFIVAQLGSTPNIVAADVGCGAGRYDELLFRFLRERLFLHCTDVNAEMLGELDTYLTDLGIKDFETHEASAHDLPFGSGSLDCIFTFNACHHFDLSVFVTEAHRALKPGGRLFLYTRTRTQNAQSVWGVHFPSFSEKETRLYTDDEVGVVLSRARGMELTNLRTFWYYREQSLDHLVDLARTRHYSTFDLYGDAEFEIALDRFARNVEAGYGDLDKVTWRDENTMYVITRTDRPF